VRDAKTGYAIDYIAVDPVQVLIYTGHCQVNSNVHPLSPEAFDATVDLIHTLIPANLGRPGIQRVTPVAQTGNGTAPKTGGEV
jgi:hypothetical protein